MLIYDGYYFRETQEMQLTSTGRQIHQRRRWQLCKFSSESQLNHINLHITKKIVSIALPVSVTLLVINYDNWNLNNLKTLLPGSNFNSKYIKHSYYDLQLPVCIFCVHDFVIK